jgi:hypothetical protein
MSSSSEGSDAARGQRHRGPSLLLLAVVFATLFIGSLVVVAAMTHGGHFPSPLAPVAASNAFFAANRDALRFGAFLQLGASVPLAIFAATASSRLRFLGIEAAGTLIALVGGTLASAMGSLSALAQWALVQPDLAGTDAARALHLLAFNTGGPGYVVPFGLLVAGVAVTGGLSRKLPRWVMWRGIVRRDRRRALLALRRARSRDVPLADRPVHRDRVADRRRGAPSFEPRYPHPSRSAGTNPPQSPPGGVAAFPTEERTSWTQASARPIRT